MALECLKTALDVILDPESVFFQNNSNKDKKNNKKQLCIHRSFSTIDWVCFTVQWTQFASLLIRTTETIIPLNWGRLEGVLIGDKRNKWQFIRHFTLLIRHLHQGLIHQLTHLLGLQLSHHQEMGVEDRLRTSLTWIGLYWHIEDPPWINRNEAHWNLPQIKASQAACLRQAVLIVDYV